MRMQTTTLSWTPSRSSAFYLFLSGISIAAITVACSSSSSGGSASSSCGNFASAEIDAETRCGSTPLSPDERANYISRFNIVCNDALGAPGSGITTAYLDACAGALGKNPTCTAAVPECNDPAGTLAVGAACGSDDQCSSTHCAIDSGFTVSPDGGTSGGTSNCGKCAPTIADGAACQSGDVCVAGDSCLDGKCGKETTSTGGTGTIGSACQQDSDCATPNRCDFTQGICAAPGNAGASCFTASDCVTGLICTSGEQCEQAIGNGGPCVGGDCQPGLGCDATSHKCATITFAAQGAACDRDAVLCDRGNCNVGGSGGAQKGVCPTIIADGQPCTADSTTNACDDFAECVSGTCQVSNPADCK